ncbi:MAG: hypothetical protein JJT88_20890 [Gammaproteobacteria bacterium]|nr:hypothetical protein [Gammaproteobacteria bacterium]
MAVLSLLDDRARPKGSRDPLGFEMVWTHFGRKVVGNLTTITSSWRIFSVGLLGFHWCNQLCRDAHPVDKQLILQQHFLRYEQLAAYLRSSADDNEIMGITRVRKRLGEAGKTISIGTDQQSLILSDQVSYGIWGLYSTALRETGLVRGDLRELTDTGLEIALQIEESLKRGNDGLGVNWYWAYLRGDRKAVPVADLEREKRRFVRAITAPKVKDELIRALLRGSGNHSCQLALYETCHSLPRPKLEQAELGPLVATIGQRTKSIELSQALGDISQIERLLVTANVLFSYLRRQDREPLAAMASAIDQTYRFDYLPDGPELSNVPYGTDLDTLRAHLRRGDTLAALRCLLDMNKKVMTGRGGAAWVEESADGRLRVRVKAETAHLPPIKELRSRWDYDYFLRSYARIAAMEER